MRNGKLMTTRVAAIALSSMMVLSPLTAFASSGDPAGNAQQQAEEEVKFAAGGKIFGEYRVDENGNYLDKDGKITTNKEEAFVGNIQTGTVTYDGGTYQDWFLNVEGDESGFEGTERDKDGNVTVAYFKKTLTLKDYKNTDYTPTVPDVKFVYEISVSDYEADTEGTNDKYLGYNGAVIHAGIPGGIKGTEVDPATNEAKKAITDVVFHHDDNPNGDKSANEYPGRDELHPGTMTKLVKFELDPKVFQGKDPGVYRYVVVEKEEQNAVDISGKEARNILDDVTKIDDKYRARILDVVIAKTSEDYNDDTRKINGIAMHEAKISVTRENGAWVKYEITASNGKVKVEGYTEDSFDEETTEEGGPKEAHSRYYTFDLLVDKELKGEGLTDADVKKAYNIDFELEGPVGAKVKVVTMGILEDTPAIPALEEGIKKEDEWTFDAEGKIKQTIKLQNNEWFEISGLPSGALYTVKEKADSILSKVYTNKDSKTEAGTITLDGKVVTKVEHNLAVKSSTEPVNNTTGQDAVVAENVAVGKLEWTAEKIDGRNDIDVQNVLITNERQPITVTGVVMNVAPYALMVIAAAIFAGLFISKKRQEEEI